LFPPPFFFSEVEHDVFSHNLALRTMTTLIVAATELFAEARNRCSFTAPARKPAGKVRPEDSSRSFS
jgi:hypothetical protein